MKPQLKKIAEEEFDTGLGITINTACNPAESTITLDSCPIVGGLAHTRFEFAELISVTKVL